jgi:5-methylcytosine-specific restriction protein B
MLTHATTASATSAVSRGQPVKPMAVLGSLPRKAIQEVMGLWRDRCLIEDGSLLFEDQQVWTPDNLARLYRNVIEVPLEDDRTFLEKFREQLKGDRGLVLLGAEAMAVYYLIVWPGAVRPATKRQRVNEVLSWAGEQLAEGSAVWRAFAEGIAHPGQYFLVRMELQIGFLVDFARRLKEQPVEKRREILDDPWQLRDFMDAADDATTPAIRHVLLHLLHPDTFERIASGPHKQSIARTYAGLVEDGEADLDEQLLTIREQLEALLNKPRSEVDFYEPPLWGTWGAGRAGEGTDSIDALELQKQLVIFGPPGTSKTYEAKQLAKQIIRRAAMREWGAVAYFQRQDELERIVITHVRRLQLHPAYSYEEFIRGLRLRDGKTVYEDGYLLRLVQEVKDEPVGDGEEPLPWVLILDELNRADLSRVFGEAFSVLEDRDSPVDLPGTEPGEKPSTLQLPEHLFVIGTMNLIDQSLEQIDFALRRRFLWQRSSFDALRLAEVLLELWHQTSMSRRYSWDRISEDMQTFIGRASELNKQIAASPLLGRDFEIGHTYFFKIVGLLERAEYLHRKNRASRILWNRRGDPLPPVGDLWRMSLEPLIDQYLQGVDAESRDAELARLGRVFLRGEAA